MRLLFVARKLAFRNPGLVHFSLPAGLRAIKKKGLWLVACGRWPWLVAVAIVSERCESCVVCCS